MTKIIGINQARRAKSTREAMEGLLDVLDGHGLVESLSAISLAIGVVCNVCGAFGEDRRALLDTLCEVVMAGEKRGLDS